MQADGASVEYSVCITWYDEISVLVLDALSPASAVEQAKAEMEKLVRERGLRHRWPAAQIEEEVRALRRYDYRAQMAAHAQMPADVLRGWRHPRLPSACPR